MRFTFNLQPQYTEMGALKADKAALSERVTVRCWGAWGWPSGRHPAARLVTRVPSWYRCSGGGGHSSCGARAVAAKLPQVSAVGLASASMPKQRPLMRWKRRYGEPPDDS